MRNHLVHALAALFTLAGAATSVGAQNVGAPAVDSAGRRLLEFGIDAGATFNLSDPKTTTINIPAQAFRVGFFMDNRLSLEPAIGINSISGGGTTTTQYRLQVGLLWHFRALSAAPAGPRMYLRPFIGMQGFSTSGNSATRAELGAGIGIKVPLVSRLATRFEVNYSHLFAGGGNDSNNAIGLLAGLSFFTR